MTRQEYIKHISSSAIRATKGTNLFPSVLIAQAAVESGWGGSSLSKAPYNNHFGIKAFSSWKGKKINFPTQEFLNGSWVWKNQYFRVYDSITESLKDRNKLLFTTHYKKVLEAKTPEQQCHALQNAGYATAPNYAVTLIKVINDNNLKRFDRIAKINRIVPFAGLLFLAASGTAFYKTYK